MFPLALLLGSFAYSIFLLGIAGVLYRPVIVLIVICFTGLVLFIWRRTFRQMFSSVMSKVNLIRRETAWRYIMRRKLLVILSGLLVIQAGVNLIGALGPELAFDALWYHLTLPNIYLQEHSIFFIPGGLLYYSAMPKLVEMFYLAGLALHNEILAKVIHFSFGILSLLALYKLSRLFFSKMISLTVCVIFYANLVVAWESITAYIDLGRTFYEVMALWAFVLWWRTQHTRWIHLSAVMLGFAIGTKLLAAGSLLVFSGLIVYQGMIAGTGYIRIVSRIVMYWVVSMTIASPWLLFAYFHTGNPFYPVLSGYGLGYSWELLSPVSFITDFFTIFLTSDDPLSPVYFITLPVFLLFYTRLGKEIKPLILYSIAAYVIWYITPRTGGGRFILPYLPAFSVLVGSVMAVIQKNKRFSYLFMAVIFFTAVLSVIYRGMANMKYVPVIAGRETKTEFLSHYLNFSFGDFYDIDGYFAQHITSADHVLLFGFHNLYYVTFPFSHQSWIQKGDRFNYIATQDAALPERFADWPMIYENKKTGVKLYSNGAYEIY